MDVPPSLPIGFRLNQVSRLVGAEFDRALTEAGGSLPVWLVLLSLSTGRPSTQRELAGLVGLTEATMSHHLTAMQEQGLVTRERNATNRRIHDVVVTDAGLTLFRTLRRAAGAFDAQLNAGLSAADKARLAELLDLLVANISDRPVSALPWAEFGAAALSASAGLHAHPRERN